MQTDKQTTSFNAFSIEAGILLQGNGVSHTMYKTQLIPAAAAMIKLKKPELLRSESLVQTQL
jgi:hypothetical protein